MTHRFSKFIILALIAAFALSAIPVNDGTAAAQTAPDPDKTIEVGIYGISIGNFEFTKGTYTMDMYLVFKWTNASLTPANFEFMNGRASSKEKIYEDLTSDTKEVWYRVQANLFITTDFSKYPFDTQTLKVIIEDSKFPVDTIQYKAMDDFLGVDDRFTINGWKMKDPTLEVAEHDYPWGETYSQATFSLKLERNAGPTAVKLFLPAIIFCIVSGLSFFFKADKITHRLGLGTSMLISAVMFHISQTSALPPLPSLILIDKIMIAVYAFLASSLMATTLIYIDDEFWKNVDYTKQVNLFGGILTIVLPFVIFWLLY